MRWAWKWDLHIFREEKEANCRLWKCERRNTRENFQSEVCDSFCDRQKERFKQDQVNNADSAIIFLINH